MRDFRTLTVWQKSHQLTLGVYRITKTFPRSEVYGLTSQMRRAALSIPSNLAEGFARQGEKERAYHVNVAIGSTSELEYQLLLAHNLEYLSQEEFQQLDAAAREVERMLVALYQKIKADTTSTRR